MSILSRETDHALAETVEEKIARLQLQSCGIVSGMDHRMTALERAFQLARSGEVSALSEIRRTLHREGYSGNQIEGPTLKRQLTGLIKAARPGGLL